MLRLLSLWVRCEFFDVRLPPDPNYSDIRTGEERKGGEGVESLKDGIEILH